MAESKDVARLVAFTDGVMAISITLLVLDIRLPAGVGEFSEPELREALLSIWSKYLGYVISFLVIGSFWVSHHFKFRRIASANVLLLWLNIIFLMVVGAIPFTTSVLSESGGQTATILYAVNMVAAALMLAGIWLYARAAKLTEPDLTDAQARAVLAPSITVLAVFVVSIGIALIDADYAKYFWLLLIPASMVRRRARVARTPEVPSAVSEPPK